MKREHILSISLIVLICIFPFSFLLKNPIFDADMSFFISALIFSFILIITFLKIRYLTQKHENNQKSENLLIEDKTSTIISSIGKIDSFLGALKQEYDSIIPQKFNEQNVKIETCKNSIKQVNDDINGLSKEGGSIYDIGHSLTIQKEAIKDLLEKIKDVKTSADTIKSSLDDAFEKSISQLNKLETRSEHQNFYNEQLMEELTYLHSIISQYSKYGLINNVANVDGDYVSSIYSGTETIFDKKIGRVIINYFDNGVITKTEMKNQNDAVIFVTDYMSGRICQTKNYNEQGEVITEQSFFDNGQVKTRTEYVSLNGTEKTIITEFDYYGNIIS